MSAPFVGEIRLFGFPRVPLGWLACDGSPISVANYDVLYAVIGTTYGGDGQTFCVPDLRGRVALGLGVQQGINYPIGQMAGEESHTLTVNEMPQHSHALMSSTTIGDVTIPSSTVHLATVASGNLYAPVANAGPYGTMAPCVVNTGNSVAHDNMMPTLVCNYCICFQGIFPSAG